MKFQGRVQVKERQYAIHPIWRGIGCLMFIIIPIMAYAGAVILVEMNIQTRWVPLAKELFAPVRIPFIGYTIPHLYANLIVATLLSILGFGVMMVIYALLYRSIGVSTMGPLDAAPIRRSPKKSSYKRR
jgi:hypothetical protein